MAVLARKSTATLCESHMNLVLQPEISEMTTEELERRIEAVRARRIVCAIEYAEGQELKLEVEIDKAHRKLRGHYEMLEKELVRCEQAIHRCEERVAQIEQLRQEIGLLEDY